MSPSICIYAWSPESEGTAPPPHGTVRIFESATDQIFRWNGIACSDCHSASASPNCLAAGAIYPGIPSSV